LELIGGIVVDEGIRGYLEQFLAKEPLFLKKGALQDGYMPETISHRDEQIKQIAKILAPSLRGDRPSNLFVYGKTGTGKTLSIKYTTAQISDLAAQKNLPLKVLYVNCKMKKIADTEYRLFTELAKEFGKAIPPTGLPTQEVYTKFFDALEEKSQLLILVLDEIDQLIKKVGDGILYNLTRINSELKTSKVCIIGISNDLFFTDHLDSRVKSSLSEEELLFPPYNALQIQSILRDRVKTAFKEGVVKEGVVEKCAAIAARDHGDARRALELLRVAGELAERDNISNVEVKYLDLAEDKIERERVIDIVQTQPKQYQLTLYSIMSLYSPDNRTIFTGEIYELYRKLCGRIDMRPLTQRRVSDIIGELDMLGIITAKVISKGRQGRTREISLSTNHNLNPKIKKVLEEGLELA
jgi:archaeal cell division control protein 6